MTFQQTLQWGKTGESAIATWLRRKGFTVLPVYEKILDEGKGPQLFLPEGCLVAPDMLTFRAEKVYWFEAKQKTAFSWHRLTNQWTTGIDQHHYDQYLKVDDNSPWPVWLLFLHRGGRAKGDSADSPAGLFGNSLSRLRKCVNHRHSNWGRTGMVYWSIKSLLKIAPIEEFDLERNIHEEREPYAA